MDVRGVAVRPGSAFPDGCWLTPCFLPPPPLTHHPRHLPYVCCPQAQQGLEAVNGVLHQVEARVAEARSQLLVLVQGPDVADVIAAPLPTCKDPNDATVPPCLHSAHRTGDKVRDVEGGIVGLGSLPVVHVLWLFVHGFPLTTVLLFGRVAYARV